MNDINQSHLSEQDDIEIKYSDKANEPDDLQQRHLQSAHHQSSGAENETGSFA